MLTYQFEKNWGNNVHELRGKYNLPLNDENVCNLTCHVEKMLHSLVKHLAFFSLTWMCSASMVFRARVGLYNIKENFKKKYTLLQNKRGRWFRALPPPPPIVHLRTDDVT